MLKIQMLKNQAKPGFFPPLPCYLAGQTYELATTEEIAMGKQFIQDGAAVEVKDAAPEAPADNQAPKAKK